MRKLAILTFLTLDGVMQSPSSADEDRSNDFKHGGWATAYWAGVMEQVRAEAMSEPYDILFGRKTYDSFATHWPSIKNDPDADVLNRCKKYVVTSNMDDLIWGPVQAITGDIAERIRDLKDQSGPTLQVHGSWQLIQLLLAQDLIDEFRLWTFPIVVGTGKRLFESGISQIQFSLVKSEANPNGTAMSIYRRGNGLSDGSLI